MNPKRDAKEADQRALRLANVSALVAVLAGFLYMLFGIYIAKVMFVVSCFFLLCLVITSLLRAFIPRK